MPQEAPTQWSKAEFIRRGKELLENKSYAVLVDLVWQALPHLRYSPVLCAELFEVYRLAERLRDLEQAARRLMRLSPHPTQVAREASIRLDRHSRSALQFARIACVLSPDDRDAVKCLVACFDVREDFTQAFRNTRRHEVVTGKIGELVSSRAAAAWYDHRWNSAAAWFGWLTRRAPDHQRVRALLQTIQERQAKERAFPGPLPVAELAARHLPTGDRTAMLFVGARGEDIGARFRGIAPERLEVIGIDPELGKASDPGKTGIALRYLRDILSDKEEERTFFETKSDGGSSLFAASPVASRYASASGQDWSRQLEVVERRQVRTTTVDAIRDRGELGRIDALYVNIQGGELAVLRGGRHTFRDTMAVQVEVSFIDHYAGAPGWREIDDELVAQGFVLVDIRSLQSVRRTRADVWSRPENRIGYDRWPSWQLAEAHLLYLRDPVDPHRRGDRLFRKTRDWLVFALWAEYHGQIDIALEALKTLAEQPDLVEDRDLAVRLQPDIPPIVERYRSFFLKHFS